MITVAEPERPDESAGEVSGDDVSGSDPIDDRLVAAVNDAFDTDPIPAELSQFAFDAIKWRVLDDELAALTFDSSTAESIGIRGAATQRHAVRFEGRGVSVSVSVTASAVVATIEPAAAYDCLVEGPQVMIVATSDEFGLIEVDRCPLPVRLVVETPAGRLVSPWITG